MFVLSSINDQEKKKRLNKFEKYPRLFKLLQAKEKKWVEMGSLDEYCSGFSVFARDFPRCEGNWICIQYNNHDQAAHVFDLIAGCFLPSEDVHSHTNIFVPPWSRSKQGKRFSNHQLWSHETFIYVLSLFQIHVLLSMYFKGVADWLGDFLFWILGTTYMNIFYDIYKNSKY